jgi:hypothetical protein
MSLMLYILLGLAYCGGSLTWGLLFMNIIPRHEPGVVHPAGAGVLWREPHLGPLVHEYHP